MRSSVLVWLASAIVLSVFEVCPAAGPGDGDVRKENAQLRRRVDKLEKDLQLLKELFIAQSAARKDAAKSGPAPLTEQQRLAAYKKVSEQAEDAHKRALKTLKDVDLSLYGYVKLDASFDSARTDVGNFARWVESEDGRHDDSQSNMTANQTRLGIKLDGVGDEDVRAGGRIEIDGYGGGNENAPHLRVRHAYMTLDFPKYRTQILAGQTWDVISPLNPSTVNFTPLWWSGNIGFRRPQIRVTRDLRLCDSIDLKLQAAVTRTIGRDAGDFDPGDTGEDAGFPTAQGRLAFTFPTFGERKTTVGISGHYGQEEYDLDSRDQHTRIDSWSANLDIVQPICKVLVFKGELFAGKDLDSYLGGIGQGINAGTLKELGSIGGWGAFSLGPWDKWRFNLGAACEGVRDADASAGMRTLNLSVFGNAVYQVLSNAAVMFELSHWHTEYKDLNDGNNLRFQLSFKYDF